MCQGGLNINSQIRGVIKVRPRLDRVYKKMMYWVHPQEIYTINNKKRDLIHFCPLLKDGLVYC